MILVLKRLDTSKTHEGDWVLVSLKSYSRTFNLFQNLSMQCLNYKRVLNKGFIFNLLGFTLGLLLNTYCSIV